LFLVVSERDVVVLRLGFRDINSGGGISWCSVAITGQCLLLFGLSNGLASLLISKFGVTFVGTPAMVSLFLGLANIR
jgi:hypothetical protein